VVLVSLNALHRVDTDIRKWGFHSSEDSSQGLLGYDSM